MAEVLRLALPVALIYLAQMTMGIVALVAVGRISAAAVGAVGLGSSLYAWFMIFGIGLLSGLDYFVSFAKGAGRRDEAHGWLVQGLWVSALVSVPLTLALVLLTCFLDRFGIASEVIPLTSGYIRILALSLFPLFGYTACRQYLQAIGIVKPSIVVLVLANLLNIVGHYVLVFGHWGFPILGVPGSAWSTLIVRVLMFAGLMLYVLAWDRRNDHWFRRLSLRLEPGQVWRLGRLGLPAAGQMMLEVGVFAVATILAGGLGAIPLAAHQIVMYIVSVTFMVPLGIGSASAVLVGQSIGRNSLQGARRAGWQGIALGVGFMGGSAVVLLVFPNFILRGFTVDRAVVQASLGILVFGALFQLFDGAQAVSTGALRGLGDTRTAMIANLFGHWMIGLPVGAWLCYRTGWGLPGLWAGLGLGLVFVGVILIWRWWRATRAPAIV